MGQKKLAFAWGCETCGGLICQSNIGLVNNLNWPVLSVGGAPQLGGKTEAAVGLSVAWQGKDGNHMA